MMPRTSCRAEAVGGAGRLRGGAFHGEGMPQALQLLLALIGWRRSPWADDDLFWSFWRMISGPVAGGGVGVAGGGESCLMIWRVLGRSVVRSVEGWGW